MRVNIGNYPPTRFYDNWLYKWFGYAPEREVKVRIDRWDTWSMDHTLAHIIVPMLRQLKETKHGHPSDLTEESWDEMLDEMIWAFEQKLTYWEEQYIIQHGEIDWDAGVPDEDGNTSLVWSKEHIVDWDARQAHQDRMTKGFKLFGEWYESLWD
jgi:hypothetical protein